MLKAILFCIYTLPPGVILRHHKIDYRICLLLIQKYTVLLLPHIPKMNGKNLKDVYWTFGLV